MPESKLDRRVQRTRALLNEALIQLIFEKGYDAVTIEDITERANVGRSTFYLHYQGKDDLLLDHHDAFVTHMQLGIFTPAELLGEAPQQAMIDFLTQVIEAKAVYEAFTRGRDADIVMRNVREYAMQNLLTSIEAALPDISPKTPADVLVRYIINAQLAMLDWWIMTRTGYSATEAATMLHTMQLALIRDAYDLNAGLAA